MIHDIFQSSNKQTQSVRTTFYGHVTSYDPELHAVKVMIPHLRDEEDEPLETDWIPCGTLMVGDKWGMQWAPMGGATKDEPEKGEQCHITVLEREDGLMAMPLYSWYKGIDPPGKGKSEPQTEEEEAEAEAQAEEEEEDGVEDQKGEEKLKGGEFILKHKEGSFLKIYEDGRIQLNSKDNLDIVAKEDCNVIVKEGDCNVKVREGDVNVEVNKGDVDVLLEEGDCGVTLEIGDLDVEAWVGDISVTAETGDIDIDATLGDITVSAELGDISLITEIGDVIIESLGSVIVNGALSVDVLSEAIVTITAPIIEAGGGLNVQQLCNTVFLELFNAHQHTAPGGMTSPPTTPAIPEVDTTISFFGG